LDLLLLLRLLLLLLVVWHVLNLGARISRACILHFLILHIFIFTILSVFLALIVLNGLIAVFDVCVVEISHEFGAVDAEGIEFVLSPTLALGHPLIELSDSNRFLTRLAVSLKRNLLLLLLRRLEPERNRGWCRSAELEGSVGYEETSWGRKLRLTLTLELEESLLLAKHLDLVRGLLLTKLLARVLLLSLELWLSKTLVLAMILLLTEALLLGSSTLELALALQDLTLRLELERVLL
jgi:hypothetical protein